MDDRLAFALPFVFGLLFGRGLDPQWRRDLRWKLVKWLAKEQGEGWEQGVRARFNRKTRGD